MDSPTLATAAASAPPPRTDANQPAPLIIQRSADRAFFDHGWLQTHHSFSFAEYFDPRNLNWGALRVFNDDTIAPGAGFGTHPHRDMEILTYVLSGELEHQDSMGNVGIVGPGGVQYMSAGTGVRHAERNHSREQPLRLVQMWVLPAAAGMRPQYGQVDYAREERLNRWLVAASGAPGVQSRIRIGQDATCAVARLEGATLSHALAAGRYGFLFVADGEAIVDGQRLARGDAARIIGPRELAISGAAAELVLWDVPDVS